MTNQQTVEQQPEPRPVNATEQYEQFCRWLHRQAAAEGQDRATRKAQIAAFEAWQREAKHAPIYWIGGL